MTSSQNPDADPAGYQIDDLTLDPAARRLIRARAVIPLKALTFDLFIALVRAAPNVVTFDQLSERVWPGLVVSPETIVQRVKLLRDALGDDAQAPRYIEGVRGRGYRLCADVQALTQRPAGAEPAGAFTAGAPTDSGFVAARAATRSPPTWMRATLAILPLLGGAWAVVHFVGFSKRSEQQSVLVTPVIDSLAVLPLDNLSGDKEQEYFADGMTDALTTDLAQIGSLRVISRTSAMHFKGSKETLPQIGRELNVDAVVEGTVTRAENRVRVTAQLVAASSDHHLWAKTYERDLKDVLAMQDEIAKDVAEQVRVKLIPKAVSPLKQIHSVDPEAYDDYLKGSYWMKDLTAEGYKKGCEYFRKAVDKDPGYAPAHIGVARCQDTPEKYRDGVIKALTLDPSLAEAHTRLAISKFTGDWDWPGAEAEHRQAIALDPNDANAHHWYSFYLLAMGRLDEALMEIERARDLDPYDAFTTVSLEQVLYHSRRFDDAMRENQRGLEMHPNASMFYWNLADLYEQKNMLPEAFAARQQSLRLGKDERVTVLDEVYKHSGYRSYLLKQAEFEQTNNPAFAAHCYALLNDEPHAMAALEAAFKTRETGVLFIRSAPELDSLRSSPRFRDLVRRIGFPSSHSDKN